MTRAELVSIARANHEEAIDQAHNMGGLAASLETYEQNMYDTITEKGGSFDDGNVAFHEWRRLEAAREAMPATFEEADALWGHLFPEG